MAKIVWRLFDGEPMEFADWMAEMILTDPKPMFTDHPPTPQEIAEFNGTPLMPTLPKREPEPAPLDPIPGSDWAGITG